MRAIFVTGTDTGVGKTVVTAALVTWLRNRGTDAVPMKPVQTGCRKGPAGVMSPDLRFVWTMAGLRPAAEEERLMMPYGFQPACSPHLAADQAGVRISGQRIERCFRKLLQRHEWVVVEGAGGVLAPISWNSTMLDLMRRLQAPVLLVSRASVGTINHTLLSLREIRRAGLPVAGVVMNMGRKPVPRWIVSANMAAINRMGAVRVWGCLREVGSLHGGRAAGQRLLQIAEPIFAEGLKRAL